jgi:hypothetical protein
MKRFVALAVLALVGGLMAAPSAVANNTVCPPNGVLGGMHGNIIVPAGSTCTVQGAIVTGDIVVQPEATGLVENTIVKGNVKALENAVLRVSRSGVTQSFIGGNIEGDKAEIVQILNSVVGGNITIKEGGTAEVDDVAVCGVVLTNGNISIEKTTGNILVAPFSPLCGPNVLLNGNIQVQENVIPTDPNVVFELSIVGNTVTNGNVQVSKNTGPGPKSVGNNVVTGAIQCKENSTPVTGGFLGGPAQCR